MTKTLRRVLQTQYRVKFTSGVIDLIAEKDSTQNTGHVNSSRDSKKSKTHLVKHSSVEKFASVKSDNRFSKGKVTIKESKKSL